MPLEPDLATEADPSGTTEHEALRIHDLVVEAGALLDRLASGRPPTETVWCALDGLRADLRLLADLTDDACACQAARDMVAALDAALAPHPSRMRGAA